MRPDGWEEIRKKAFSTENSWIVEDTGTAFEMGADAIITALKDEGVYTYGNHTPVIPLEDAKEDSGYWCFLPDEGYSYGKP